MRTPNVLKKIISSAGKKVNAVRTGRGIIHEERRASKNPVARAGLGWLLLTSFTPKRALLSAFKAKHPAMYLHSVQVGGLSVEILNELRASGVKVDTTDRQMRQMAMFHDIGKLLLPKRLIGKSRALSDKDYRRLKKHVEMGAGLGKGVLPEMVVDAIAKHQELVNGQGYPKGLSGNEIPMHVKVLSVADSLSAMVSSRGYRKSTKSWQIAFNEIKSMRMRYEGQVVDALGEVLKKRGLLNNSV